MDPGTWLEGKGHTWRSFEGHALYTRTIASSNGTLIYIKAASIFWYWLRDTGTDCSGDWGTACSLLPSRINAVNPFCGSILPWRRRMSLQRNVNCGAPISHWPIIDSLTSELDTIQSQFWHSNALIIPYIKAVIAICPCHHCICYVPAIPLSPSKFKNLVSWSSHCCEFLISLMLLSWGTNHTHTPQQYDP